MQNKTKTHEKKVCRASSYLVHPHEVHPSEASVMSHHGHRQEPPEAPLKPRILFCEDQHLRDRK